MLRRGAVFHADIGIFVPGNLSRYPLVEDGGRKGWREGSSHWEIGRALLDGIMPSPGSDVERCSVSRGIRALLPRGQSRRARHAFESRPPGVPSEAELFFDSAYLHQELSSPAIQASVQQVRADDVNVTVDSRGSELQRAEQFFRDGLARAPDDADARVRLGHTLGELGRHEEAAAELRTCDRLQNPIGGACTSRSCSSAAKRKRSEGVTKQDGTTNRPLSCTRARNRRSWR